MKNTVKKILALVFVVAMVCSLAVPAFAAKEEYVKATVVFATKVDVKGLPVDIADVTVDNVKIEKATVESVLKAADEKCGDVTLTFKNGQLAKVNNGDGEGELGTGAWVVALNGKIVSEDLGTVAVTEDDVITVYLNEATFGTKLAQYDDSAIAQGIISFYYYDAEGNKQPLVGATVELDNVKNLQFVAGTQETAYAGETNAYGLNNKYTYASIYTTDENGQIWIAPQHLAELETIKIVSVDIEDVKALEDIDDTDYDVDEFNYYNANVWRNLEARAIEGNVIVIDDLYDVAGATGDMTVVYVLVAFVAVATIAAVVVMKKKSVKAN